MEHRQLHNRSNLHAIKRAVSTENASEQHIYGLSHPVPRKEGRHQRSKVVQWQAIRSIEVNSSFCLAEIVLNSRKT